MSTDLMDEDPKLFKIRHSLAHVMAQAMQELRPDVRLGFGPAVADGFYYDFLLKEPFSADELPQLQKAMRRIILQKQEFSQVELSGTEALTKINDEMKEPHKAEYAGELLAKESSSGTIGFYTNGPFTDMCEGPHVESTKEIPPDCFHLYSVTGAYWRGDEKRDMMTRVYGWAFKNKKDLAAYRQAREEALKRDHRKLGASLDLYAIHDLVGAGLPHWLPKGTVLIEELEKLAREWEFQAGYQPVRTPVLTRGKLYEISGHMDLYREGMFPGMASPDDEEPGDSSSYFLRPMNCPHHHMVFASRPRSYRDLPLRLSEYGHTFRYERSGTLHGLSRVRSMCMNDAHIYVTEDQIEEEFMAVMSLHERYYKLFGFENYFMRLSLWDPEDPKGKSKYVDDPRGWELSEARVRSAMKNAGIPFKEVKGEAAFYGPKVDIQFRTVGLKEFTVSTCQLDFAIPARFLAAGVPMTYRDKDGSDKLPYVIHRAPLSTHERFISFLIEHYGGAFPMWLAPVQVRMLPVSGKYIEYADKVCAKLREQFVRAEVDRSEDKLGKKIRKGATEKIPCLVVIGEEELENEQVTLRRYQIQEQRKFPLQHFVEMVQKEIRGRLHVRSWEDLD